MKAVLVLAGPSLAKLTVPVAAPDAPPMEAVKVTLSPATLGFCADASVTLALAFGGTLTPCESDAELPAA